MPPSSVRAKVGKAEAAPAPRGRRDLLSSAVVASAISRPQNMCRPAPWPVWSRGALFPQQSLPSHVFVPIEQKANPFTLRFSSLAGKRCCPVLKFRNAPQRRRSADCDCVSSPAVAQGGLPAAAVAGYFLLQDRGPKGLAGALGRKWRGRRHHSGSSWHLARSRRPSSWKGRKRAVQREARGGLGRSSHALPFGFWKRGEGCSPSSGLRETIRAPWCRQGLQRRAWMAVGGFDCL